MQTLNKKNILSILFVFSSIVLTGCQSTGNQFVEQGEALFNKGKSAVMGDASRPEYKIEGSSLAKTLKEFLAEHEGEKSYEVAVKATMSHCGLNRYEVMRESSPLVVVVDGYKITEWKEGAVSYGILLNEELNNGVYTSFSCAGETVQVSPRMMGMDYKVSILK